MAILGFIFVIDRLSMTMTSTILFYHTLCIIAIKKVWSHLLLRRGWSSLLTVLRIWRKEKVGLQQSNDKFARILLLEMNIGVFGDDDTNCMLCPQEFFTVQWRGMLSGRLNWRNSWHLTYWRKIKNCILTFWAFTLLNLFALRNGEQNYRDTSRKLVLCLSCFLILYLFGSTEALEFAQNQLTPFGKVEKYVSKLEVCCNSLKYSLYKYMHILYMCMYVTVRLNLGISVGLYGFACLWRTREVPYV